MFKQIITLCRGQAHEAVEGVAERHALTILDQQIRDAGGGIAQARRALALAMAEDSQEAARLEALATRVAGLEARAVAALRGGREELAADAAVAIAELETDRQSAARARALFGVEISRLKGRLKDAERRFAGLHRGRRLARVGEAVRRSRNFDGVLGVSDAEATLAALRERQELEAAADEAMESVTSVSVTIEERLGAAGFGDSGPQADKILARLRELASGQE
jgi:phage shock protein A